MNKILIEPEKRWASAHNNISAEKQTRLSKQNEGAVYPDFTPGDRVLWQVDQLPNKNPKLAPKWRKAKILYRGAAESNYFIQPASGRRQKICVHVEKLKLDTSPQEEATDPTFQAPAPHTDFHMTLRARKTPQVSAVRGLACNDPGLSYNKHQLSLMFNAYAAHFLTPPEITTHLSSNIWIPPAIVPQAQGAHQAVLLHPVAPEDDESDSHNSDTLSSNSSSFHSQASQPISEPDSWRTIAESSSSSDEWPSSEFNSTHSSQHSEKTGSSPPLTPEEQQQHAPTAADLSTPVRIDVAIEKLLSSKTPPASCAPNVTARGKHVTFAPEMLTWQSMPSGRAYQAHISSPPEKLSISHLKDASSAELQAYAKEFYGQWADPQQSYFPALEHLASTLTYKMESVGTMRQADVAVKTFLSQAADTINAHARGQWETTAYVLRSQAAEELHQFSQPPS